jgi:hypothetical protein
MLNSRQHDSDALRQYRACAAETARLRAQLQDSVEQSQEIGDMQAVQELFEEFSIRRRELEGLQQTLEPAGVFLAAYGVEVINDHAVSLVIPRDRARIEILEEAQRIAGEPSLIDSFQMQQWRRESGFVSPLERSVWIRIDGHVLGSEGMNREQQEKLLSEANLMMPTVQDLAVAFAVFYIATGEALFGWRSKRSRTSCLVRALDGALHLEPPGLSEVGAVTDLINTNDVGIAALIKTEVETWPLGTSKVLRLWGAGSKGQS